VKILYVFLCENAQEEIDERMHVHGVFRRLYAPGFPAEHQATLVIGVEWDAGETGDQPFKIDLLDPDDSPVITASGHTTVPDVREGGAPPPLSRLVLPIERMVFPVPGRYEFELTVAEERIRASPLYLMHVPDEG
jgi:hypothetical protein